MAFGLTTLVVWGPLALLSVMARAPAQVRAASPLQSIAVAPLDARSQVGQAVLRKLNRDPFLEQSGLTVSEQNGIVELRGTVPVSSWRARAARIAGVVRDVRGVVNRIDVVAVRRPDKTVAADIRRSLRATAALAKMPITVRVTEGVVELSGVISTWEQQQLAERVAARVAGVRFCQNQLTSSTRLKRTAGMIAADIRSRLEWDPLVQQAPINVTVSRGRVSLAGAVGSALERRRVVAHAWVKSVVAVDARAVVVNVLKRPDNDVRLSLPTDAEVSVALRDLLPLWPSIAASNLSMSVAAGVVTVRGTVQTLSEKRAVEDMVRSAVGVVTVNNELRGPWWKPPAPAPAPAPVRLAPPLPPGPNGLKRKPTANPQNGPSPATKKPKNSPGPAVPTWKPNVFVPPPNLSFRKKPKTATPPTPSTGPVAKKASSP
jgi:osmotically-inducible protein OsmY